MYEEHLKRAESVFGKFSEFPDASPLEKCILLMKENGCTYKKIMLHLGNPSKKIIRETILKYKPELLNETNNPKSGVTNEKRLAGLMLKFNIFSFDLDEFDECNFDINNNNKITFCTEYGDHYTYSSLDERTQLSILYNVAKILNIDVKSNEYKLE